ncbi:hypothetical protein EDB85DRAFT_1440104 [Lactarius pseudohatsudake]|nr:hypothetical protein EDB85DRAFT_1440104 [Lactarius pseudohatsudake]
MRNDYIFVLRQAPRTEPAAFPASTSPSVIHSVEVWSLSRPDLCLWAHVVGRLWNRFFARVTLRAHTINMSMRFPNTLIPLSLSICEKETFSIVNNSQSPHPLILDILGKRWKHPTRWLQPFPYYLPIRRRLRLIPKSKTGSSGLPHRRITPLRSPRCRAGMAWLTPPPRPCHLRSPRRNRPRPNIYPFLPTPLGLRHPHPPSHPFPRNNRGERKQRPAPHLFPFFVLDTVLVARLCHPRLYHRLLPPMAKGQEGRGTRKSGRLMLMLRRHRRPSVKPNYLLSRHNEVVGFAPVHAFRDMTRSLTVSTKFHKDA